jgi:hypothetical protein
VVTINTVLAHYQNFTSTHAFRLASSWRRLFTNKPIVAIQTKVVVGEIRIAWEQYAAGNMTRS